MMYHLIAGKLIMVINSEVHELSLPTEYKPNMTWVNGLILLAFIWFIAGIPFLLE